LYQPWFHDVQVKIYGVDGNVSGVTADSKSLSGWTAKSGIVTLPAIEWGESAHHLRISMAPGQR